jgi:uncharacterized protein YbjT (DUF2867 family)
MKTPKILITGATGATGQTAVKTLCSLGVPVRAMVRQLDAQSERLQGDGVEIVKGDLTDFDTVVSALEGITSAYFVYPIQVPGLLEATAFFAQAAIEQKVSAIVNISQITARRNSKSHAARNHWIAERLLDRSGIAITHLRPTLFAEWLLYLQQAIKEKDILPLAFGDGRYAPIAAEDIGRVIAAILNKPDAHAGKTYPLYGPQELSQYDVAAMLTNVLGRTITYVPMEIPAFAALLGEMGFTAYFQQHISAVCQDCRDGVCSGTNDLVETLTGQAPQGMMDYVTQNKALFMNDEVRKVTAA